MASLNKATKGKQKLTGKGSSPLKAKTNKMVTTHEGASAHALKAKTELFLACVSGFAGEKTFYQDDRTARIVKLTHKVTEKDPQWVENFVAWLRGPEANIRTASLIVAAEYVAAGGPNGRQVVNSVCQRADEPAELLAYWLATHPKGGKRVNETPAIPQAIRKGLSDAVRRLYNEYSVLKYNGGAKAVSMADVLNLLHVKPATPGQGNLFKYIIDKSYDNDVDLSQLEMIRSNVELKAAAPLKLSDITEEKLSKAGMTWEQMGNLLEGGWTSEAWGKLISNMGYMALLRNLRNFEGVNLASKDVEIVNSILSDPERVAKSRQLPFRFLTAYKNVGSAKFVGAIEQALDLSVKNVPAFPGRTLVLVDTSGSMSSPVGGRYADRGSDFTSCAEAASMFGVALRLKGEDVDVVAFGTNSRKVGFRKGSSVLTGIKGVINTDVGWSTNLQKAIDKHYNGHDRIVVLSDMQTHRYAKGNQDVPYIHFFDLRGYGNVGADIASPGRYLYGGLTDATFKLMLQVEQGESGNWPWESE